MKLISLLCFVLSIPLVVFAQQPYPSTSPSRIPIPPRATPTVAPIASQPRATASPIESYTPDLVTVSGRHYKRARVGSVDPDGINYFFEGGVVKVPFTDLPEDTRKQYGYDPKKAAAFAAQDDAAQQRLAEDIATEGRAEQQRTTQQRLSEAAEVVRRKKLAEGKAHAKKFRIQIIQSVSDGVLADLLEASYSDAVTDSLSSIGGGGGGGGVITSYSRSGKTIFVQGVPSTAEGERLEVSAFQDGLFKFTDTKGAGRTVAKWVIVD